MSEELAELRGRLLLLKKECQTIGQAPPHPNTLRAAFGGVFVSIMQRLMFWYAPPLQRTIGGLIQTVEDAVQMLGTRLQQEEQRSAALETRLHQVHSIVDEQIQALRRQYDAVEARLKEQIEALGEERATTIDLENNLHEQVDTFQQFQEDQAAREKVREERVQMMRRDLVEHSRRVAQLLEEARRRLPGPLDAEQLRVFEQEALHDLDPLYSSLEDETRGTREEIRERLRAYLPYVEQVKARLPQMAALDLGCGRGEWLELLRIEGHAARGVDWNRLLVEDCAGRELSVEQGDALEYLARVPDASLGVVTAFRLAEHLPFRKLVRLLDEMTRVLATGGVAILETPNPENLVAGAQFYKDPTRHHPIPCGTLRFLVESRGLSQVQVIGAERLEYAVVGWKV